MCDTSQQPALGYMQIVNSRDEATLLHIIRDHVENGTTIWSDQWAAYRNVQQLPSYLDEFLWRERYGGQNTLDNLYRDISLWYPV